MEFEYNRTFRIVINEPHTSTILLSTIQLKNSITLGTNLSESQGLHLQATRILVIG